jgi:hypothetical protein
MSFDKLSKKELVEVANKFGADSSGTKNDILAALEAEGVDFELYETLNENATPLEVEATVTEQAPDPKHLATVKTAPEPEDDEVILAYRGNASQTIRGQVWSKDAPYVVVSPEVAETAIAKYGWVFEVASAKEASEFYS